MKLNSVYALAALLLVPFAAHAQNSCPSGGTLPRYEDARDQKLPAMDSSIGSGERSLVENTLNRIIEGIQEGVLNKIGGGAFDPVVPIMRNGKHIVDTGSPDQNVRVDGFLGLMNGTAWSLLQPLQMDSIAKEMLYGLTEEPDAYVGESLDHLNRRQLSRAGCDDEVWTLPPYNPRGIEPIIQPKTSCAAVGVDFDPMLSPAEERSGINSSYYEGFDRTSLTCDESGITWSSSPSELSPEFDLVIYALIMYHPFASVARLLHYDGHRGVIDHPDYEPRGAENPVEDAYAIAIINSDADGTRRVGAAGHYLYKNVQIYLRYESSYLNESSVPSVQVEQQVVMDIVNGLD